MVEKIFTVVKTRRGVAREVKGTVPELVDYFRYTLESGNSYDSRVSMNPKTVKSLVSNLNRATRVLQKGSYDPNSYEVAGS